MLFDPENGELERYKASVLSIQAMKAKHPETAPSTNRFEVVGYWLYPSGTEIAIPTDSDNDSKIFKPVFKTTRAAGKSVTRPETLAIAEQLKKMVHDFSEREAQFYNAQPVWRLRELSARDSVEALQIVDEFLKAVQVSASEYCWPMQDPGRYLHWRVHGWKHIVYDALEKYWKDYNKRLEPAAIRAEAWGNGEQVEKLFRQAAARDPEAVGIVWTLHPTYEDQREMVEHFCRQDFMLSDIPTPADLAFELVETIYSTSKSSEVVMNARNALLKLVAPSVAKGSRSKKGRPKILVSPSALRLLWKMSYSLAKQVLELDHFLRLHVRDCEKRTEILHKAYPWIRRVCSDVRNFRGPVKAPLQLLARVTGISTASLEKMRIYQVD